MRSNPSTMPLVRHKMSQLMQQGLPHLLLAMANQQRVQLDPRLLDPRPTGRRSQPSIPADLQSPGELSQPQPKQPFPTLRSQHATIHRMFIRTTVSAHPLPLPRSPLNGNLSA